MNLGYRAGVATFSPKYATLTEKRGNEQTQTQHVLQYIHCVVERISHDDLGFEYYTAWARSVIEQRIPLTGRSML